MVAVECSGTEFGDEYRLLHREFPHRGVAVFGRGASIPAYVLVEGDQVRVFEQRVVHGIVVPGDGGLFHRGAHQAGAVHLAGTIDQGGQEAGTLRGKPASYNP